MNHQYEYVVDRYCHATQDPDFESNVYHAACCIWKVLQEMKPVLQWHQNNQILIFYMMQHWFCFILSEI